MQKHAKTIYMLILTIFLFESCSDAQNQNEKKQVLSSSNESKHIQTVIDVETFHDAAYNGIIKTVKFAIEQGVPLVAVDQDGQNALMLAAFNGHTKIAKLLIEQKVPINAKDNKGRTALIFASTGPFPKMVQLLLDHKAKIDIIDNEEHFSALMFASSEGQLEVVKILMANGADASLKDIDGDNAEAFARQNGHTAVAEYIEKNSK